jgi:hypothetical protein
LLHWRKCLSPAFQVTVKRKQEGKGMMDAAVGKKNRDDKIDTTDLEMAV